jgi:hypothetical protein
MLRDGDTISLAILAQFCAVGVALDYLFPELGGAYLGPLFAGPMEELSRIVYERSVIDPLAMDVQLSLDLMECRGSLLLSSMMGTTSPHAMHAHDGIWASCPEPSFSLSTTIGQKSVHTLKYIVHPPTSNIDNSTTTMN